MCLRCSFMRLSCGQFCPCNGHTLHTCNSCWMSCSKPSLSVLQCWQSQASLPGSWDFHATYTCMCHVQRVLDSQPKRGEDDRKGNRISSGLGFPPKTFCGYFPSCPSGTSSAFLICPLWVFVWFLWSFYSRHSWDWTPWFFFLSLQWTCWSCFFQNEDCHDVWNSCLKIRGSHLHKLLQPVIFL